MSTGAATSTTSAVSTTATADAVNDIESPKPGDKTTVVHFLFFLICFTNRIQK